MTKMCYDILLSSLSKNYMTPNAKQITEKWVRRIWADTLGQAAEFAKSLHPNLGCTPVKMSMGWHIWPTPEPKKSDYFAAGK